MRRYEQFKLPIDKERAWQNMFAAKVLTEKTVTSKHYPIELLLDLSMAFDIVDK